MASCFAAWIRIYPQAVPGTGGLGRMARWHRGVRLGSDYDYDYSFSILFCVTEGCGRDQDRLRRLRYAGCNGVWSHGIRCPSDVAFGLGFGCLRRCLADGSVDCFDEGAGLEAGGAFPQLEARSVVHDVITARYDLVEGEASLSLRGGGVGGRFVAHDFRV